MKIVITGMPDPYVIKANKEEGRLKDKTVARVDQRCRVVKVGELLDLCSERPTLALAVLREEIERGDFG